MSEDEKQPDREYLSMPLEKTPPKDKKHVKTLKKASEKETPPFVYKNSKF